MGNAYPSRLYLFTCNDVNTQILFEVNPDGIILSCKRWLFHQFLDVDVWAGTTIEGAINKEIHELCKAGYFVEFFNLVEL